MKSLSLSCLSHSTDSSRVSSKSYVFVCLMQIGGGSGGATLFVPLFVVFVCSSKALKFFFRKVTQTAQPVQL